MDRPSVHKVIRFFFHIARGVCLWGGLLLLTSACQFPFLSQGEVPFDIKRIIPPEWIPTGPLTEINVDEDEEPEWLLFYRYDLSGARREQRNYAGPIGGVVFDQQIDRTTGLSFLAQHDLLPDIRSGKGQGFLGERECRAKTYDTNGDGTPDSNELAVFGLGYGPSSPVYLSIFQREPDPTQGYRFRLVRQFYGDGGITVEPAIDQPSALQKVSVLTRLNDRSLISKRTVFVRRTDEAGAVQYEQDLSRSSLQFTYGIPENPYYPEAAVLAYYALMNSGNRTQAEQFLMPADERPAYLARVREANLAVAEPTTPAWNGDKILPLTLTYSGASEILSDPNQDPIYYSAVTVQESSGTTKVWDVIGFLDARCGAGICWQFMSWK